MAGPLAGIKILEVTAVVLGPFACQMLADMGAEVIKVEPPHGDRHRAGPQAEIRSRGIVEACFRS
jgi:crotonobetainyl-CoA:carnitine CoA-transferase CaiB-like acyl-CoA transferase